MKGLALFAGILSAGYLGIEGYAWHWNPFVVFAAWLVFVLLVIVGFVRAVDFMA